MHSAFVVEFPAPHHELTHEREDTEQLHEVLATVEAYRDCPDTDMALLFRAVRQQKQNVSLKFVWLIR